MACKVRGGHRTPTDGSQTEKVGRLHPPHTSRSSVRGYCACPFGPSNGGKTFSHTSRSLCLRLSLWFHQVHTVIRLGLR